MSGATSKSHTITVTATAGGDLVTVKDTASFALKVIHPCQDPAFAPTNILASPIQRNPAPYLYTEQGAFIKVEDFIAEPKNCPVVYECVQVSGASNLQCDDFVFASNQVLTLKTFDMAKFTPGDYDITIKGSAG